MRTAIIEKIHQLMMLDKNIYFLTGDLGYSVIEKIERDFPRQFINVGVAEQNMIGIAAGLALSGKKVAVYSIIPFVTMRCFEQIRDDICYHNLNVKILGVGSGLSYGFLGSTHFALEDIGIMRCLPRMTIVSPADPIEASLAVEVAFSHGGPLYLRIGKKGEPRIFEAAYKFKFGKGVQLKAGRDVVIFATGSMVQIVLQVVEQLRGYHIAAAVVNIHTLKPIDDELIRRLSRRKKLVVTVEEHSIIGGLGSCVSEVLARDDKTSPPVHSIGINDEFVNHIGSQTYLREKLGLSVKVITKTILARLKKSISPT